MKKLASQYDILLVQEHWLHEFQLHKLREETDCKTVCSVSGMDPAQIIYGRPYGGCAILIKNDRIDVEYISTACRRLCACIVQLPGSSERLLILNVYMPCESVDRECSIYFDVLLEMTSVIENHVNVSHVLIGGDLNTNISTRVNSSYVQLLSDFCTQHQLNFCVQNAISRVDYTYVKYNENFDQSLMLANSIDSINLNFIPNVYLEDFENSIINIKLSKNFILKTFNT